MLEIIEKKDCTGCHACSSACPQNCISMKSDHEGFWYPVTDNKKCTKCGLCEKVCPLIQKEEIVNLPIAYAAYNKDEEIRLDSSSGGIFTLVAENVIKKGGVVFGACFDNNFNVIHNYTETKKGLIAFRGSKYVQSKIGETYKEAKEFLKQGRLVLFTGTPCQVGGLKSYLEQVYENLFCIDIICHGVPSPKVWQEYVAYRESSAGVKTCRISFRDKSKGWMKFSVSFLFHDDTEYLQTLDKDLFMQAFLSNICLRPSCYFCNFKTLNRQSDMTLGDFWGIQNLLLTMNDDKGISLVFINSNSGRIMFEEIRSLLVCKETNINSAVSYNTPAIKSVKPNPKREAFFNQIGQIAFNKLVAKYCFDTEIMKIKKRIKAVAIKLLKKNFQE
jgi:coenzyme F420-reducing hydrogenase beta subunit